MGCAAELSEVPPQRGKVVSSARKKNQSPSIWHPWDPNNTSGGVHEHVPQNMGRSSAFPDPRRALVTFEPWPRPKGSHYQEPSRPPPPCVPTGTPPSQIPPKTGGLRPQTHWWSPGPQGRCAPYPGPLGPWGPRAWAHGPWAHGPQGSRQVLDLSFC